jgi:hypothetical protein
MLIKSSLATVPLWLGKTSSSWSSVVGAELAAVSSGALEEELEESKETAEVSKAGVPEVGDGPVCVSATGSTNSSGAGLITGVALF